MVESIISLDDFILIGILILILTKNLNLKSFK